MMADPKYANLPGIAPPDEKDVYETDDLPEVDQDVPLDEPESEFIERPQLNVRNAHERFRGKGLEASKGMDFSDAARRRRNVGYLAVSGDWEIAAAGEPETLLQRRNRLQAELTLLIADLKQVEEGGVDAANDKQLSATLVPELESSLQQLCKLNVPEGRADLTANPSHYLQNIQKLVKELNENEKKKASKVGKTADSFVTYELNSFPAQAQFSKSSRVADLELRLKDLEAAIGTTPDNLQRLQMSDLKNVGTAVSDLSARVNLLDLNTIDAIDVKLGGILSKMDGISDKRGGPQQVELEAKVNELYESYRRVDALSQSLLPVADRLAALTTLNQQAAEFKATLTQLKVEMKNVTNKLAADEAAAGAVRQEIKDTLLTVTSNIENFNKRLQAVSK